MALSKICTKSPLLYFIGTYVYELVFDNPSLRSQQNSISFINFNYCCNLASAYESVFLKSTSNIGDALANPTPFCFI